ncbi:MAG: ferritin [Chloroflexota bacterium]
MLLTQPVVDAINTQVGEELAASNQYLAIALHFDRETLPELSQYFHTQSQEEHSHAMKLMQYLNDLDEQAIVPAVSGPKNHFETAAECVELALTQELKVTKQINNLVDVASDEKDHLTQEFLRWFVNEQIEEVSSMNDLLDVVKRAGEDNLLRVEEFLSRNPHDGANGA